MTKSSDLDSSSDSKSTIKPFANLNKQSPVKKNITQTDNLQTTQTDMMFDYLADPEKIVSEDKKIGFIKENYKSNNKETENNNTDTQSRNSHSQSESTNADDFIKKKSSNSTQVKDNNDTETETDSESCFSTKNIHLKKLEMLRKLGEFSMYGIKLSQKYTMQSSLKSMKFEYQLHKKIKNKKENLKVWQNGLKFAVGAIEVGNRNFNPFDINLDGWYDNIDSKSDSIHEALSDLYEKYNENGEGMSPEMRLLIILGTSAAMTVGANYKMEQLANSDEKINDNPDLKKTILENARKSQLEREKANNEKINLYSQKEHENINSTINDYNTLQKYKNKNVNSNTNLNNNGSFKPSNLPQGFKQPSNNASFKPSNLPPGFKQQTNNTSFKPSNLPPGFTQQNNQLNHPSVQNVQNQKELEQQYINKQAEYEQQNQRALQQQQAQYEQQQQAQRENQAQREQQAQQAQQSQQAQYEQQQQEAQQEQIEREARQAEYAKQKREEQNKDIVKDNASETIASYNSGLKIENILKNTQINDTDSSVSSLTKSKKSSKSNISISFGSKKRKKNKSLKVG